MASGLLLVASDVGINRFIDGSAAGVVVEDGDWVLAIESAITLLPNTTLRLDTNLYMKILMCMLPAKCLARA